MKIGGEINKVMLRRVERKDMVEFKETQKADLEKNNPLWSNKEQHELDVLLLPVEESYLKLFKFNWFEEIFIIILQVAVVIVSFIAFIWQLSGHLQQTVIGFETYIAVAAGAIFSLLNFLKYLMGVKRLNQTRKETQADLLARRKRMSNYYVKVKEKNV